MFLTQDMQYRAMGDGMMRYYVADHRLALLRQVTVAGAPAAELLDMKVLVDLYPAALLVDSDKLLINGRQQQNYWYGWGGDVAGGPARPWAAPPPAPPRRRCPAGRPPRTGWWSSTCPATS